MRLLPLLILLLSLSCSRHATPDATPMGPANWQAVYDLDFSGERINMPHQPTHPIQLTRRIVERPTYDGPPGQTEITATFGAALDSSFSHVLEGQYRILGVDPSAGRLLLGSVSQFGAVLTIRALAHLDAHGLDTIALPRGEGEFGLFQFAELSPEGTHVVLVDQSIRLFDLDTQGLTVLHRDRVPEGAADPTIDNIIGGDVNLTGDYMRITWTSPKEGQLEFEVDGTTERLPISVN